MTTIHFTGAQRDTFAACGLIVIEGVDDNFPDKFDPVGDWRDLDQPCDTCGGEGVDFSRCTRYSFPSCPDCVGGRRVVTLTATCLNERACAAGDTRVTCRCTNPVVTLGRFTIPALLPVIEDQRGRPITQACVEIVTESYQRYWYWDDKWRMWMHRFVNPRLDPLPRPGQFIVGPERVEVNA